MRIYCFHLWLFLATVLSIKANAQRTYGGFYSKDKLENIITNCKNYAWAGSIKETSIKAAKIWVNKTDEELWKMVPGQYVPRTIDVTLNRASANPRAWGCLVCGNHIVKHGNYPYLTNIEADPWKIECPSCHTKFPTNDFEKYYNSGINKYGVFDSAIANKSLLYNTDHPGVHDPLHKYGVDDGWGYGAGGDKVYRFVGYYTWRLWEHIIDGLEKLSDAWLYTGDTVYAHKAAILLDRVADVYPDMKWNPYANKGWYHSDGGGNQGKIGGSIWETNIAASFASCYDKIISGTVTDKSLFSFLAQKSKQYSLPSLKGSRELWIKNIDDGILREIFKSVLNEDIRGNQGMHQLSIATAAIALNTQPETDKWLNWLFEPLGGAIPGLMFTRFDRDGTSDEGAPGYALIFATYISKIAELIHGYGNYSTHNILTSFPQLRASFGVACKMLVAGKAIPNQGDSGATGFVSNKLCNPHFAAMGYWLYKDSALALEAYMANNKSGIGLYAPLYTQNPGRLRKEIEAIAANNIDSTTHSRILSGYGYAILETENRNNPAGLVINYGRSLYHAHPDQLNFDLFGFDKWLMPDHGYPEFATKWPSNQEWTGSTLSHNLVMVNNKPQKENWTGHTKLFHTSKGISVVTINANEAYPETEKYERTMLLIGGTKQDKNYYAIDFFEVKGGDDHLLSYHTPPGEIRVSGLNLVPQKGTLAGIDVPKGAWARGFPVGFSHLYNLKKNKLPLNVFTIDNKVDENYRPAAMQQGIHIKLHSLNTLQSVVTANGDPPQNKPGNPKTLNYTLMRNTGKNLNSVFVNIVEPYLHTSFISNIKRYNIGDNDATVVEVLKKDGTIDYIIKNNSQKDIHTPQVQLSGAIAFLQVRNNKLLNATLINTTYLKFKNFNLKGVAPVTGRVVAMNKTAMGGGWIIVDKQFVKADDLLGKYILINTKKNRDATYLIQGVEATGKYTKLFCGPIHFIKGFVGPVINVRKSLVPAQYDLGYEYDFDEGDTFRIGASKEFNLKE